MIAWLCSVAAAATWTVPTDFATITDAVQSATDGDTIVLRGTFTESVVVDEDLVFEAHAGEGAVWIPDVVVALEIVGDAQVEVRGIEFDGVKTQRLIQLSGGPTVVLDGIVVRNGAAIGNGGGVLGSGEIDLTIRDARFEDNTAESGAHVYVEVADRVAVRDTVFTGGVATVDGGAIAARTMPVGALQVARSWFQGNTAAANGGALALRGIISANLDGNLFCDNTALVDGGAIATDDGTLGVAIGNVVMENLAVGFGGGLYAASGAFTTTNNHFVANVAEGEGAAIYSSVGGSHLNDLFAYNVAEKKGLAAFFDAGGLLRLDYAGYHANAPNSSTVLAPNLVNGDPQFVQWGNDPCDPEDLYLQPGSPLIDAGDPSIVDFDGTRSDIGAFGGPAPFPVDLDGDGSPIPDDCDDTDKAVFPGAVEVCNGLDDDCDGSLSAEEEDTDADGVSACEGDCDDEDSTAFPGAPEVPGDGLDQDCDGVDLCYLDEDGDGFGGTATLVGTDLECAGAGQASLTGDCDDGSADVAPDAPEIECNGIDDDCDASTEDCPGSAACGCASSGSGASGAWLLVALALAWRRRRR